jgi:predicted Holliday junction resolvase-like endonuclease
MLAEWRITAETEIRRDAVRKSDSVNVGKITEHFVPYLPEFGFNPRDARFIGSPIDFVVFDGLSEGDVRAVCFVEVKTGRGQLSTRERRIRDAVMAAK